ncbi:hypothetical protein [Haloplasma contractile]|uniref:Transposase IS66 protein n=1 Tax=Haloplasma contractile SSD-17B TaxID=1033810 RepID=U2EBU6_9MOLU|nr:hypothetical protein [Haloplasma contractile]ERJ12276.1 Transposase IS66 protein [Haloplasma contractile SSD-17B]
MPNCVIPGSLAASSLIAFIMNKKYTNGMPLYRIEQESIGGAPHSELASILVNHVVTPPQFS